VKRAADRMYRIGESAEKLELCGRQDGERGLWPLRHRMCWGFGVRAGI